MQTPENIDIETVKGFGQEWSTFTQEALSESEQNQIFQYYFSQIDWKPQPKRALDMGCGSGRWTKLVAPRVGEIVAADASPEALAVAKQNVKASNVSFVQCSPETLPFPDGHFDFIFSLGVLHHLPDTAAAIRSLAAKLSPKGTLLLYLYYAFDNRPVWFRMLWRITDLARRFICRLPFPLRLAISGFIALTIYWPLARTAKYLPVPNSWPLKIQANHSFYTMRTDALDRFGTKLEKRFTRPQIVAMLRSAGLDDVQFADSKLHWVCTARKLSA